jgi:hypothetical protein
MYIRVTGEIKTARPYAGFISQNYSKLNAEEICYKERAGVSIH